MSTEKESTEPKRKKDTRALVSFVRAVAENSNLDLAPSLLDQLAKKAWGSTWLEMWRSGIPKFPTQLDFGSPNMRALALVGLWHPATREGALASLRNGALLDRTIGFEKEEPGSRIYGTWTLMGYLLAYRWAMTFKPADTALDDVREYLSDWLRLWFSLRRLSMIVLSDGPFSLRCGARSQGTFGRTLADYADSIAFSVPWEWRGKPQPDRYLAESDEVRTFNALTKEIKEHVGSHTVPAGFPSWPTIAPTHYLKTSTGSAVWCERADINRNTPGISFMMWRDGVLVAGPNPSRAHIRQKRVPQEVTVEEHTGVRGLRFKRYPPGVPEDRWERLPDGEIVWCYIHDQGGLRKEEFR